MKIILVFSCIGVLVSATIIGIAKYARLDNAMRIVVAYIMIQLASETIVFITGELEDYKLRAVITNIYTVVNICLITQFFISAVVSNIRNQLTITNIVLWPAFCILNVLFFQSLYEIGSNFLLLTSFGSITMSLYLIYMLLRNKRLSYVFGHPHFRIAILWLFMWSATMFFWATIKILYRNHWKYTETLMHIHGMLNTFVYLGIGATLFFYPKKLR